jgi:TetR/AcrR family transcriptional repressor of nem operon
MPKEETFNRELVLQAAIQVFHNKGYSASSMQDIVTATGLNRSVIYNSFGSKHALFTECLYAYRNQKEAEVAKIVQKAPNALAAIELALEFYYKDAMANCNARGCLIVKCCSEMGNHDPAIDSFLRHSKDQALAFFKELLAKGQKEKWINTKKTAEEYAWYLYSSIQGLFIVSILNPGDTTMQNIIHTIMQTLA